MRKKMHKVKSQWVVLGATSVALLSSFAVDQQEVKAAETKEWQARSVEQIKADIEEDLSETGNQYEIRWGDTLSAISQATDISVEALANINEIANIDLIYAGNFLYFSANGEQKIVTVVEPESNTAQSFDVSKDVATPIVTPEDQKETIQVTNPEVSFEDDDKDTAEQVAEDQELEVEKPSKPVEPAKPTQPEKPAEPEQPTQPEVPVEPELPTKPETPVEPELPEVPAEPVLPEAPAPETPEVINPGQDGEEIIDGGAPIVEEIEEDVQPEISRVTQTITTPFDTQVIYDSTLEEGTEVVETEGVDGVQTIVTEITEENGEVVSEEVISDETTAAVTKVVRIGTKPAVEISVGQVTTYENGVQYALDTIENPELPVGESRTISEGTAGYDEVIYEVTYHNGEEVSREEVSRQTVAPVNAVVEVGTKPAVEETITTVEARENIVNFETERKENDELAEGVSRVVTEGQAGYDLVTYEVTYHNGEEVDRVETDRQTIAPVNEVVEVGTKSDAVVETKEETRTETIPYETETVINAELAEGETHVKTPGVNGERTIVENVTYVDGERVSAEVVSSEVTTEAVTEIVEVGSQTTDVKTESRTEPVNFETVYEDDDSLYVDESYTKTEGVEGVRTITEQVTYVNGEVTNTEVISDEVTTPAINEVIVRGTQERSEQTTETETERENVVEFTTSYEEDATLPEGEEKVIQEGRDGYDTVTYEVVYENGVEVDRYEVKRETTDPVAEIIARGTKVEVPTTPEDLDGDGIPNDYDNNPEEHHNGSINVVNQPLLGAGEYQWGSEETTLYKGTGSWAANYVPQTTSPVTVYQGDTFNPEETLTGFINNTYSSDPAHNRTVADIVAKGGSVAYGSLADTVTPGTYDVVHTITYADGTQDTVTVQVFVRDPEAPVSELSGKTWYVLGDSNSDHRYTANLNQSTYDQVLAERTGMVVTNIARASGDVATGGEDTTDPTQDIVYQVTQVTGAPDIITIFAGINDFNHGVPIGEPGSTDKSTLYGALNKTLGYLSNTFQTSNIVYIKPAGSYGRYGNMMEDAARYEAVNTAIEQVTAKYGVQAIDFVGEMNYDPATERLDADYVNNFSDGLHLNQTGHNLLADQLEANFKTMFNDVYSI